jgi:hypothetical protein
MERGDETSMAEQNRSVAALPDNDPYLGRELLYIFDLTIALRLDEHKQIASHTGGPGLSDLQRATIEIVPQAVSIALAIRELVRQANLFPAFVLLRPLIERTATVAWLRARPEAVAAWHHGRQPARRRRPRLSQMLTTLHEWDQLSTKDPQKISEFSKLLHQIVHGDPSITHWNVVAESDGEFTHGMGKMLHRPGMCDFVCLVTLHYFSLVTKLAQEILLPNQPSVLPSNPE